MKTKDAFALRDFNKNKFLQRPMFKNIEIDGEKFLKDNSREDKAILESFAATDNVNSNELNLRKLQAIQDILIYYQEKLIDRHHIPRLIRFKRKTKNPDLKVRAGLLHENYDNIATEITMIIPEIKERIAELEKIIQQQNKYILAQRLKQARKAAGLTQKKLASAVNMTQGGYVSYEIARREPPLTTLIRLSKVLDKTTDWLLGIGT